MKNMFLKSLTASGLVAGALLSSSALAADATGSFQATTSVSGSCVLVTENVAFGSYDGVEAKEKAVQGNVGVRCTDGVLAYVLLDQGLSADADSTCSAPKRRMKTQDGKFLAYELYIEEKLPWSDSQWGCSSDSWGVVYSMSSLEFFNIPVGGVITAGQNAQIGVYTDTVGVTVTF